MILDEKLEFCDQTAASGSAGTALLGDQINLDDAGRELLDTLYLVIQVTTAFGQASGSPTVNFQLASDASASIATNGSASIHWQSGALATSVLTAGKTFIVPLPSNEGVAYEQYLGILAVTASATTNAGAINAFLTNDPQRWKAYADAQN